MKILCVTDLTLTSNHKHVSGKCILIKPGLEIQKHRYNKISYVSRYIYLFVTPILVRYAANNTESYSRWS